MTSSDVTLDDILHVVKRLHNWKSPGLDKIQNYWWKYFTSVHVHLKIHFNDIFRNPSKMPVFLNQGITYLKPKNNDLSQPKNYRPITCLNTMFKLMTNIVLLKVNKFITENNIMCENQKGCREKSKGCKEQLVIDHVLCAQAKKRKKNISVAWIDYAKAYDSVPHSWLLEILNIYKIDPVLINFLKHSMQAWCTKLSLSLPMSSGDNTTTRSTIMFESEFIPIKRGIFQGDGWSPMWFCLSLNPLSNILNNTNKGYKLQTSSMFNISHLLYVDDLKIYARNNDELQSLLETTAIFSSDINMQFGIEKCATLEVKRGNIVHQENIELTLTPFKFPSLESFYKYLGMSQDLVLNKSEAKEKVKNAYASRMKKILTTELNGQNKIKAINSWCVPILSYSFGIIPWTKTDLQALDRQTRVLMTQHRIHHPRSCMERLYLPRAMGGRGLINLEKFAQKEKFNLKKYFLNKKTTSPLHQAIVDADDNLSALDLKSNNMPEQIKNVDLINRWEEKPLHSRFKTHLNNNHHSSNAWLKKSSLFGETEGFVLAIQDEVIETRNYMKHIEKKNVDDRCRLCQRVSETIQHITSSCSILANTDYLQRHNSSAKIVHQFLALKFDLTTDKTEYYKYQPQPVLENENMKIYWDSTVITDRRIEANRPDIVLVDKNEKTVKLIDIAHPADHNILHSTATKIHKYQDLAIEIRNMWDMTSVEVIPVVMSTNGLIHPSFYTHTKKIDLPQYLVHKIQKSVLLENCRLLRRFLSH